jgi:hypothetical protein
MEKIMTSIQQESCLIAVVLMLLSCADSQVEKITKKQSPDTVVVSAQTLAGEMQRPGQDHPLQYEGKKVDSIRWKDNYGSHYFIVSIDNKGELMTANWSSQIHGNLYTTTGTGLGKDWEMHDSAASQKEMIYLRKSLKVKDIDGDGKSEVWYFYRFDEDGADPVEEKLVLYSGGGQLTVKGLIPRSVSDLNSYQQNMDKEDQVNAKIKTFALEEWERNAIKEIKFYNGDDVTEEEDYPFKKNKK